MCQAPPKALSHTLKHRSFTSPAEEGSLGHCQGSKKANESQPGLCGDRGDPGLAQEHVIFEKEHYPPRCSLSGWVGSAPTSPSLKVPWMLSSAQPPWQASFSPFPLLLMLASAEAGQVGMW